MDIKQIFEQCYLDENHENQTRALSWLKRVDKLVESEQKDVISLLKDEEFIPKLIRINKGSKGIGTAVGRNERFAKKLLKYFGIDPIILSSVKIKNKDEDVQELFSSLDDVLDLVDEIGATKNSDYNADALLNVKSFIILAWRGLSLIEIVDFKKSDVFALSEDKLYIRVNDISTEITPREYSILVQHAENDYIVTLSGRRYNYTEDCEFLIRNNKGSQASDKRNFCIKLFEYFNKEIAPYYIGYKQLRLSGQFEKVWKDTTSETTIKKLLKYVDCDTSRVYEYEKHYELWLKKQLPDI